MKQTINSKFKSRLDAAFKNMRKRGLFARQNFMCCMGCATSDIGTIFDKNPGKYIGAAYYHKQDGEGLLNTDKDARVYIGYGAYTPLETSEDCTKIGEIVCECLSAAGLSCDWNHDPNLRILVKLPVDEPTT